MRLSWDIRKWGFVESMLALLAPGLLYVAFLAVDLSSANKVHVEGSVTRLDPSNNAKRVAKCIVSYSTRLGVVEVPDLRACDKNRAVGSKVEMTVRVGRLTGQLVPFIPSIKSE